MLKACNEYLNRYYRTQPANSSFHTGAGNSLHSRADGCVRVLEAGGGSFSHFALPNHAEVFTVDIDLGQLQRNQGCQTCIQGDIHSMPVKAASIDIIICFNVIEHLNNPDLALEQFDRILKPGGLLILGCPVRNSLKGIITRMTPVSFHRWYYKNIVGKQDRGDGHYDAFPTPFRPLVSEKPIKAWCEQHNFKPLFFRLYDGSKIYGITVGSPLRRLASLPYYAVTSFGRLLSFNHLRADMSDLLLVAEKSLTATTTETGAAL